MAPKDSLPTHSVQRFSLERLVVLLEAGKMYWQIALHLTGITTANAPNIDRSGAAIFWFNWARFLVASSLAFFGFI